MHNLSILEKQRDTRVHCLRFDTVGPFDCTWDWVWGGLFNGRARNQRCLEDTPIFKPFPCIAWSWICKKINKINSPHREAARALNAWVQHLHDVKLTDLREGIKCLPLWSPCCLYIHVSVSARPSSSELYWWSKFCNVPYCNKIFIFFFSTFSKFSFWL